MSERFDDAVVGAGIIGLAHAFHLARRGRKVVVFERSPRAAGASVRNFGMLWPIGQPPGALRSLAVRSVEIWREVLGQSGLWHDPVGSLHVAYRDDELQVLREFADLARESSTDCELLDPKQVLERSPGVKSQGLLGALWSPSEVCVDPRLIVGGLPKFLAETYGVRFEFDCAVVGYDRPRVLAGGTEWQAGALWVCTGEDFQTLYPDAFQASQLFRCKLQMMRSEPVDGGWRLGPMLAAGPTLRHYRAFEACPGLPALRARIAAEYPEFDRFGIHVMASQNGRGEVVVGDSHEYRGDIEPFDKREIDDLILGYLATFLEVPGFRIASRWNGTYLKHPSEPYLVTDLAPGATSTMATGGMGMTLSFGLAEQVVNKTLGES